MPESRLELRLELPSQGSVGAAIEGRLTIENAGSEPVSVVPPFTAATLSIGVFDRYWNVVAPRPEAKEHAAWNEVELGPGDSLVFELPGLSYLSGTARMSYALGPGIYYVLAVYHPGTDRLPDRSSYPVVAVSNVAQIEIAGTEPRDTRR